MKKTFSLTLLLFVLLSACGPSPELQGTFTATAQTATAVMWTETPTFTFTLTDTPTFTPTLTPTFTPTFTPSLTPTDTIFFTPTFNFPKVTVNKTLAACLFGPAKAYLWKFDLHQGDTGFVGGRAPVGDWLYVKFDRLSDYCWLSPYVVDVVGDVKTLAVQPIRLWITDALYSPPQKVRANRDGDEVTVTWKMVDMTEDDDRGYFLDVWVCQNGNLVWMPTSLPDKWHNSATFTDESGCSQASGGKLYAVEKHGYISPVDIPWPDPK
jgi:hypothetical protein